MHPELTDFCTGLTGITQENVDADTVAEYGNRKRALGNRITVLSSLSKVVLEEAPDAAGTFFVLHKKFTSEDEDRYTVGCLRMTFADAFEYYLEHGPSYGRWVATAGRDSIQCGKTLKVILRIRFYNTYDGALQNEQLLATVVA